jgi:hypothetical protein
MSLKRLALLAAALTPAAIPTAPAEAQRRPVRQVIIFGADPCPRGTGNEIIVCARRPESERYRLPTGTRPAEPADRRSALARDQEVREAAATGTDSCSTVGPGGQTGCLQQQINRSRVGIDGDEDGASSDDPDS